MPKLVASCRTTVMDGMEVKNTTSPKVIEARKDEASDKLDAEYKVTLEKCDALAGNAKDACIANAKKKYGK